MGDRDVGDDVPNHTYRRVGVDDLEQPALPQLFANAQIRRKRLMSNCREPDQGMVGLIDDVVGSLSERFLGIVGDEQTLQATGESNGIGGPVLLLQLGDRAIVYVAVRARHGEPIAKADGATQHRLRETAQRSLNRETSAIPDARW